MGSNRGEKCKDLKGEMGKTEGKEMNTEKEVRTTLRMSGKVICI